MKKRILGFIGVLIILLVGIGLFSADFSDLYWGTAYKRILVLRNDTALTGLPATTPDRVYDGEFTATPFSLSEEEMLFDTNLQLQFRNENMFIQSDGLTSLLIDGNAELKLTGTAITLTGVTTAGNFITTGGGTSAIDDVPIGAGTPDTGAFTTLSASGTFAATGTSTLGVVNASGNIAFDGGTFNFNGSAADLDFTVASVGTPAALFVQGSDGYVGIGTNVPTSTLYVSGTFYVSSTSSFAGAITALDGIDGTVGGVTPAAGTFTTVTATTATLTTVNTSGVTTLSDNLIMSSADIQMNSGNGIYFDADDNTGIVSNAGDVLTFNVGGTPYLNINALSLSPDGNRTYNLGTTGTKEFANVATYDIGIARNATIGGTLGVTGATTLSSTVGVVGAARFNTGQADIDFTVLSDDNAIALVVDASEDNVEFGASISFNSKQQFTDSDATPSVAGYSRWDTNTTGVTITDFDDGAAQQYIIVRSMGAITFDVTGTSLIGGTTDIVTASGDITHWLLEGTDWYLQTYIDQSDDLN